MYILISFQCALYYYLCWLYRRSYGKQPQVKTWAVHLSYLAQRVSLLTLVKADQTHRHLAMFGSDGGSSISPRSVGYAVLSDW